MSELKWVLCRRLFEELRRAAREERRERVKQEHKEKMWRKVNGWLRELERKEEQ